MSIWQHINSKKLCFLLLNIMCCYPYHLVKGLSSIWIILPIKPNILKVDNEDKNASKFLIYIQLIFENSKFLKIFSFSFVG